MSLEFLSFNIYNLYRKTYFEKPQKLFSGSASEGEIILDDDITQYDTIIVQSGIANSTLMTSIAKSFAGYNFRVNTDFINCPTDSGKFKATIKDNTTLAITQCDDAIRYIWGYTTKYDFK